METEISVTLFSNWKHNFLWQLSPTFMRIKKYFTELQKKTTTTKKHDASKAAKGFHVLSRLPAASEDLPERWIHIRHIVMQTKQHSWNSQLTSVRFWIILLDSINYRLSLSLPSHHPLQAATTWMNAAFIPIATGSSQLLIKLRGLRGRDAPPQFHWQSGRCQVSQTNRCSKFTGWPSAVLHGKAEGKQMYFSWWTRWSMTWTSWQGKLMRANYGFPHPTAQMICCEVKKRAFKK